MIYFVIPNDYTILVILIVLFGIVRAHTLQSNRTNVVPHYFSVVFGSNKKKKNNFLGKKIVFFFFARTTLGDGRASRRHRTTHCTVGPNSVAGRLRLAVGIGLAHRYRPLVTGAVKWPAGFRLAVVCARATVRPRVQISIRPPPPSSCVGLLRVVVSRASSIIMYYG